MTLIGEVIIYLMYTMIYKCIIFNAFINHYMSPHIEPKKSFFFNDKQEKIYRNDS